MLLCPMQLNEGFPDCYVNLYVFILILYVMCVIHVEIPTKKEAMVSLVCFLCFFPAHIGCTLH